MLRASLGAGLAVVAGCGRSDTDVLAGQFARPVPTTTTPPTTTAAPTTTAPPTTEAAADTTGTSTTTTEVLPTEAVVGQMVIEFTYTQAPGGKNEFPYVSVWIEDSAGELLTTVALFYELTRRGERWLDHLHRWWEVDQLQMTVTSTDLAPIVTAATRAPGAYAVVWDGTVQGVAAPAGDYFVCIEAVREDGPYSLIREPFTLAGSLSATVLPDDAELTSASVRIDA